MKLIIGYFATIFIFATFVSTVKVKNTQLFEAIQKSMSAPNPPPSKSSIFGNFENPQPKVIII